MRFIPFKSNYSVMDSLNGGVSLHGSGEVAALVNGCGAHYNLCMSNGYSLGGVVGDGIARGGKE